jgi:TolA-binding protein
MAVQMVPAAAKIEDYAFGLRLLEDGHLDAAILAFESYLKNNPEGARRAEARFFLAETQQEKGVIAEALRGYRTFLAENPEHPFRSTAHFRVAKIELGNGRLKAAAGQFSKVRDGPMIDQALYQLGQINFRLEDWAAAIRAFSNLLGRFPSSPFSAGVRYVLGIAHYKNGQDTQALTNLQAYLKSPRPGKVESLWAHAVAGMIRKRQGNCEPAIRHFEVVLQADPRFPPRGSAAWWLAECLYEKKDYHSAAKKYAAYLETYAKSPQITLARIRAGHSHFLAGRYRDALGYFRKLAKENVPPQYRQWVMYWTARSLDQSGDPDAALRGYEELIRSFPDGSATFDAAAKAAAIRFRRKEYERAVEILSVLKGGPDGLQAVWAVRMTGEAVRARPLWGGLRVFSGGSPQGSG